MPIDLGDSKTRSINLTTAAGAPTAADSLPTYAITLPDGTAGIGPAVQTSATPGEYYVVYPTVQVGLHAELWTAVVGGVTVVIRRSFTVEDTLTPFVDTEEAIAHLRAAGIIVAGADLEQLRWLCMVACAAVHDDLGRKISRTSVTETFDGGQSAILLRSTPLISVTTVVESGTTLTAADYTADTSAGIVFRGGQQSPRCWLWGRQNVVVTFVAGYITPPRVARKVALNGVQRMWAGSQQMPHPSMDDFGAEQQAAAGTLTPLEMAAYNALRAPGFA
jgi:hypothetical protein